jgi:hypothetical protein
MLVIDFAGRLALDQRLRLLRLCHDGFLFARNRCSPSVRYSTAELGFAALISIAAGQLLRMTGDDVRHVVANFDVAP